MLYCHIKGKVLMKSFSNNLPPAYINEINILSSKMENVYHVSKQAECCVLIKEWKTVFIIRLMILKRNKD